MPKQQVPHWVHKAVIYQIYPRSFHDSNGDGIGDLTGIIKRLDYLNDGTENSLGIDAIWLSPIYPSPMKDFGYDVADFMNIDPIFGTLDDFDRLVRACHDRKIRVIMDYIPNHSSSEHPWFIESKGTIKNDKRDWYIWRDPKPDGSPPNNWISVFGGSAWEFDEKTGQYYYHSFHKDQPDLNWRNPAVVSEMLAVLRFWMDRGVDGFRIDAYDFLFEHPDFPDEPVNPTYKLGTQGPHDALVHVYSFDQPATRDMIKQIAGVLAEYDHTFMVTEVYAKLEALTSLYSHVEKDWYAPFNFGLIFEPWTAEAHKNYIDAFDRYVGSAYFPTWVLGNHDQPRIRSRIGEKQARMAAVLQMTLRGIPFVYYGDEIGMENGIIAPEHVQDPFEIQSPGLGLGRDPQRTPMQWGGTEHAGFSSHTPWLPVHTNKQTVNVAAQKRDPASFFHLYRRLIHMREHHPALSQGTYESFPLDNPAVFSYRRTHGDETIIVCLNYADTPQPVSLPYEQATILVNSDMNDTNKPQSLKNMTLPAYSGTVLRI